MNYGRFASVLTLIFVLSILVSFTGCGGGGGGGSDTANGSQYPALAGNWEFTETLSQNFYGGCDDGGTYDYAITQQSYQVTLIPSHMHLPDGAVGSITGVINGTNVIASGTMALEDGSIVNLTYDLVIDGNSMRGQLTQIPPTLAACWGIYNIQAVKN
jgi:hypothetical protein